MVGLLEQVHDLLSTAAAPTAPTETIGVAPAEGDSARVQDEFDRIIAGMGAIGQGVSVAGDDQDPPVAFGLPRDPALERLLPVGNRQDPEAAAEFRAMTEQSLLRRKLANLETAVAALGGDPVTDGGAGFVQRPGHPKDHDRVTLSQPAALAVLVALTDVRLVLADRLGLVTEADTDALQEALVGGDPDDPRRPAAAVYDFLSWLQESLALAMLA